ncbi:MAG: hypothetical protein P4M01_09345 [Acidobacteriota bacterium]|nr:hypothetical protein [Acidobacteriota bacterium]
MNFEVNGIGYFLRYDAEQSEWFLVRPSWHGFERVEIYCDRAEPEVAQLPAASSGAPCTN